MRCARTCVPVGPAAWLQAVRGSVRFGRNKPLVVCSTRPRQRCSQAVLLLLSVLERHLLLEQRHHLPELHTHTHFTTFIRKIRQPVRWVIRKTHQMFDPGMTLTVFGSTPKSKSIYLLEQQLQLSTTFKINQ